MKKELLTLHTARRKSEAFIDQISDFPGGCAGTGIVICGGGLKYFTNAWVAIRMLRKLGCTLPVQIWHLGPAEIEDRMRAITIPYDVEYVDAHEVRKTHPVRILNGWELKPFSILYSRFERVLLLDADNVPVVNPEFLFHTPQFQQIGAIFWPDFGHLKPSAPIWDICGVPYRDEPEWEAGQIVVDKGRCWRALRLAMWYNEYSDFYYQYILGDKDTYHLAFRKLDQPVAMPSTPVRALKWTLCQHDFEGNRIFQHRVNDKWSLDKENDHVWGFQYDLECHTFLDELQAIWFAKKQRTPRFESAQHSQKANEVAREITGTVYQYERVGFDTRPMTFASDGRIGLGANGCETYWDLKEEQGKVVLLLSSKTEPICSLNKLECGRWEGQWLRFERMPIVLTPARHANGSPSRNVWQRKGDFARRHIAARVSAEPYELFSDCPGRIRPILASMGIDLRLAPPKWNAGIPSARQINGRISPGEWNLLFHAPKPNVITQERTVWITSWNSPRLSAELVHSLNTAACIIVPSEWNASCFSCAGINRPIWIVHPGIDTDLFVYAPMDMEGPCVFGVADIEDEPEGQGHAANVAELFLEAFAGQKDVALKIYSTRSKQVFTRADPRVEITMGPLTKEQLASWFRELTCLISIERPQGWPVMEHKALATGRPLLATRFGGVVEFFSEEAGYPVEFTLAPGTRHQDTNLVEANPTRVIELMQQVYRDRAQARQLGINGRALVSEFTWTSFGQHLLRTLKSVNAFGQLE